MLKPIALATLAAGTLDILFAVILTLYLGREPGNMLRYVASGPFPHAEQWGAVGAVLGLIVHFALMAIMATGFVLLARPYPDMLRSPLKSGLIYGLITYVVMNWIVVPLRFDTPLPPKPISIATQLFAHIVLVGLPIAWITAKTMLRPASGATATVRR
jgi:membrane associated rhomboid family serine protease